MVMVQIMGAVPLPSYGCISEERLPKGWANTSALHMKNAAVPAQLPPRSPLLKGEQISCTCGSASEQHSDAAAPDLAPEVTQGPASEQHSDAAAPDPAPEVTQGPPQWLQGLFTSDLFNPCPGHANVRKNECNFYCLACTPGKRRGMCKYCLADHKGCAGQVFQIRKYMYQTCVHVEDLQHLFDTSGVQAYCINGKRAVLIHPKVMAPGQQCPVFDNNCRGCEKPLRSDCQYCSLRCKVDMQYGRAPCTPDVVGLDVQPRAPMTAAPSSSATPCRAADSDGSARSSYSQWTCAGRGKKRKCEKPLRSHIC